MKYIYCLILLLSLTHCQRRLNLGETWTDAEAASVQYEIPDYELLPGYGIRIDLRTPDKYITNYYKDQRNKIYFLDKQGKATFPFIGELELSGMKLSDAKELILEKTRSYVQNAYIEIRLARIDYTILGAVRRPGSYAVSKPYQTLYEAFGEAGGLQHKADATRIVVLRKESDQLKVHSINLTEKNDLLDSNKYFIYPGDQILIDWDDRVFRRKKVR